MNPTHETDAFLMRLPISPLAALDCLVEFTQRLERERNEARDQLYRIAKNGFGMQDTIGGESCVDYAMRRIGEIQRERDEARACLEMFLIATHFGEPIAERTIEDARRITGLTSAPRVP